MERYEISIGTKEPKFRAGATFVDDQQTVEWYTPETVIKRVLKVFGKIDLDPCADPSHHIPATIHYTEADDGLTKNWKGRVFVNPPYGEGMARWMHKANEEVKSGTAKEIILLLPARTNAGWFQTFGSVSSSFCFPKGGLRFVKGETMREGDAAMFPSVIVYMGQNRKRFKAAFKDLGMVLVSV
jgi:phage N-6-adenine-methyltransferase